MELFLIVLLGAMSLGGLVLSLCVVNLQKRVAALDRVVGQLMVFRDKTTAR